MLLDKKEITEYHDNGTLFYRLVIAEIEPMFIDMYSNSTQVRRMMNGNPVPPYVILLKEKYFDNGQFAWRLEYDEMGDGIKKHPNYRKDGTIILY